MFKNAWLDLKTRRTLDCLGQAQYRDITLTDTVGEPCSIERLVLTTSGISLVQTMRYPGVIFCAEDIEEWTQMLDGKSYRFANPLMDLNININIVRELSNGMPVDGYLFFDHRASFPKGQLEHIIQLESIPSVLFRDKKASLPDAWQASWESLGDSRI